MFVVVRHGHDISTSESLQYELTTIEAATNRFATENMIGKGGFGEVYKVNMLTSYYIKKIKSDVVSLNTILTAICFSGYSFRWTRNCCEEAYKKLWAR